MDVRMGRRALLRTGSGLGLLWLTGCADGTASIEKVDALSPKLPTDVPPAPIVANTASTQQTLGTCMPWIHDVLPRSRWTASDLEHPEKLRLMNGVSLVTVSHSKTSFTMTSEAATIKELRSIRSAHMQRISKDGARWADIGHHFIVDRAGRVWEGRPLLYQGAHVQDHNEHNVGVMCLGNFMLQSPSKEQTDRLDRLLLQIAQAYSLGLGAIRTHRELAPTENPGNAMQAYMDRTRGKGGALYQMMAEQGLA